MEKGKHEYREEDIVGHALVTYIGPFFKVMGVSDVEREDFLDELRFYQPILDDRSCAVLIPTQTKIPGLERRLEFSEESHAAAVEFSPEQMIAEKEALLSYCQQDIDFIKSRRNVDIRVCWGVVAYDSGFKMLDV